MQAITQLITEASARGGCVEFKSTLPEKGDTRKGKVVNELKNKAKANTVEESRCGETQEDNI